MKTAHLTFLLAIAFLGVGPMAAAKPTNAELVQQERERLEHYDFPALARLAPKDASKELSKLTGSYSSFLNRPDLALEAEYWAARNPGMPQYMERRIRDVPVTLENLEERGNTIYRLENFPAEWAVRLLARLMIENEPVTSSKYDLSKDEDLMEISRLYDIEVTQMSNAFMAGAVLSGLKMPHWAERPKDMSYRDWLIANEGRLGEFVKAKWGDKAVLNAELGLGPDNLPLAARAANPPATAPAAGQGGWQWPVAGGVALLVLMAVWWWRACGRV